MQNSSLQGGEKIFFLLTKCFYILTLHSPLADFFSSFSLWLFSVGFGTHRESMQSGG